MSETLKKKPDFNTLDLSRMGGVSEAKPDSTEVPAPIDGVQKIEKSIKEGAWIYGKDIAEVTPDEFKDWLATIIPGTGVEKWENSTVATPNKREKVITKLSQQLHRIFCFPQKPVKDDKEYLN